MVVSIRLFPNDFIWFILRDFKFFDVIIIESFVNINNVSKHLYRTDKVREHQSRRDRGWQPQTHSRSCVDLYIALPGSGCSWW